MSKKNAISQADLIEALKYDPETGIFRWRKSKRSQFVGQVAGVEDKAGYVYFAAKRIRVAAHQAAWMYVYGVWPSLIDHIDGIKSNNRIDNLRVASQSQNLTKKRVKSASGIKYVVFDEVSQRYRVATRKRGYVGYFATLEEAAKVAATIDTNDNGEFATLPRSVMPKTIDRPLRKRNTSGHRGVSWYEPTKRWRAVIKVDKRQVSLGYFEDLEDAGRAYCEACERYGLKKRTTITL